MTARRCRAATATRMRRSGEVWLLFENEEERFPLYPGPAHPYRVRVFGRGRQSGASGSSAPSGSRLRQLTVRLDFPVELDPQVWGVTSSLTAEPLPLRTPITEQRDGERVRFEWTADDPPLNGRYRLEWRFRAKTGHHPPSSSRSGSDRSRAAGIIQRGAPMLTRAARPFDLPEQASLARDIIARLADPSNRIERVPRTPRRRRAGGAPARHRVGGRTRTSARARRRRNRPSQSAYCSRIRRTGRGLRTVPVIL